MTALRGVVDVAFMYPNYRLAVRGVQNPSPTQLCLTDGFLTGPQQQGGPSEGTPTARS